MSDPISKRAFRVLQEDGVRKFSQKAVRFTYTRCLNTFFSAQSGDIDDIATQKTQIEPSMSINIAYDGESDSVLPDLLSRVQGEIVKPQREILEFDNAKLLGNPPFVNIGLKNFYICSVGNSRKNFSPLKHPLQDITPPRAKADKQLELGFVVGGSRGMGGFPFLEQLPKIYWYEKYCRETDLVPNLIISGKLSDMNRRSLELVGYPPSDYVHHQGTQVIDIDRLAIPPHPHRTRGGEFRVCPSAIRWIRDKILSNISPSLDKSPDRLYVSRADADRRQVVNENKVVSLLEKYGFESIEPGQYSFDNQVQLFAEADMIVGPHGAGLSNMIYSRDAKILELMTKESGEHYFVLANECGHSYDLLQCEPKSVEEIHPRYRDMYVDIHSLEDKLTYLLDDAA